VGKRPVRWAAVSGALSMVFLFGSFYRPVVVLGHSMEPALKDRQIVWMGRQVFRSRPIRRGDVVVFHHDDTTYVKRVAGLAGDTIRLARFPDGEAQLVDVHRS